MPQFILRQKDITISSYFIEMLMPSANPTFVKIYLYALMLATNNIAVDNSVIAAQLGILESDVVGAFSYWQSVGMIKMESDAVEFLPVPAGRAVQLTTDAPVRSVANTVPASSQAVQTASQPAAQPSYSTGDVAKAISENSTLSEVFIVAQSMLGKTLSTQDTITLYSFYDWLGFQPEIIIMLLDHCISMGKTSMNYIEKVALSWHFHELFTAEAVNEYLANMQNVKSFMYGVRKILGILDRNPTVSEEEFINSWHEKYGMSEDMVALAYDLCIMQTQKLSMPYMDKIMQRWHEQGITTVEAARLDRENHRDKGARRPGVQEGEAYSAIKRTLGIGERALTPTEMTFITAWYENFGMSEDMIALAYDLCIMQTQKLSMPYMDKIIRRWHEQGISTVEAARAANESFRNRPGVSGDFEVNNPGAYDYDEIERRMWENMKKDN